MLLQVLSESSDSKLTLHPTGIKIASITSSPELCLTDSKEMFYVKKGHELELKQLSYLKSKHFPIPKIIAFDPSDLTTIATKDSGISLEAYFERHISMKQRQFLLEQAGLLLKSLHKTLRREDSHDVLRSSYSPTAHIVDCFFYKYPQKENRIPMDLYQHIKAKSAITKRKGRYKRPTAHPSHFLTISQEGEWNKLHNASLELQHLIYLLDRVGMLYMRKMTPYVYEIVQKKPDGTKQTYKVVEHFSESPMYGDFKPENLIVEHVKNPTKIFCIDPEIMLGDPIFDLAKFINRYLIDIQSNTQQQLIINFLKSYSSKTINVLDKAYGPFTFLDLMALDLLNLFKSLLSRYSANEKHYRLALHLDNAQFCNRITQLILDIQTIHSNEEFYNYLRQT